VEPVWIYLKSVTQPNKHHFSRVECVDSNANIQQNLKSELSTCRQCELGETIFNDQVSHLRIMSRKHFIVTLLLFLVRAPGASSSNASFNTDDHCRYDNSDHCLTDPYGLESSSACSNSCNAPRGIEEPEGNTQEVLGDDAYGMPQVRDVTYEIEIEQTMSDMKLYFKDLRNNPNTTQNMLELLDNCKNKHENCAFWKVLGECDKVRWV
jgi:hypothetical protein